MTRHCLAGYEVIWIVIIRHLFSYKTSLSFTLLNFSVHDFSPHHKLVVVCVVFCYSNIQRSITPFFSYFYCCHLLTHFNCMEFRELLHYKTLIFYFLSPSTISPSNFFSRLFIFANCCLPFRFYHFIIVMTLLKRMFILLKFTSLN